MHIYIYTHAFGAAELKEVRRRRRADRALCTWRELFPLLLSL